MSMPTAKIFLANAYRMRSEAKEFLAEARAEGDAKLASDWERMLAKTEDLVFQAEKRFGVPHKPL